MKNLMLSASWLTVVILLSFGCACSEQGRDNENTEITGCECGCKGDGSDPCRQRSSTECGCGANCECSGIPSTDIPDGMIIVSTDGSSSGSGTLQSPLDLATAFSRLEAGGGIWLLGGIYQLSNPILIDESGTESAPVRIWGAPDQRPILDFQYALSSGAILIRGDWVHFRDIEVKRTNHGAFDIATSSHCTFERCSAHHNGGWSFKVGYEQLLPVEEGGPMGSLPPDFINVDGQRAAYNTFINCDAYNNCDWWTGGTNADGFVVGTCAGNGNKFIGCRSWNNSDDGWDFWECGRGVVLIDCWTWGSGQMGPHMEMYFDRTGQPLTSTIWKGDGNGFKFGGGCFVTQPGTNPCQVYSRGTHVLRNCVAFGCSANGIDQNQHLGNAILENCMSFGNGLRNFTFYYTNVAAHKPIALTFGKYHFRNNISFDHHGNYTTGERFDDIEIETNLNNSWFSSRRPPGNDFEGQFVAGALDEAAAMAPRGLDGSLPTLFAKQKSNSFFLNQGTTVPAISIPTQDIQLGAMVFTGTPQMGPVR